jgi:hypothetical protein
MTVTKKHCQRKVDYTANMKSSCLFMCCLLPLFPTCGLSDFSTKLKEGFNFTYLFKAIKGTSSISSVSVRKGGTVSCQNFGLPSMAG